jgi:hypothetical protein
MVKASLFALHRCTYVLNARMIPFWRVPDAPDHTIRKPLSQHFKQPSDFV